MIIRREEEEWFELFISLFRQEKEKETEALVISLFVFMISSIRQAVEEGRLVSVDDSFQHLAKTQIVIRDSRRKNRAVCLFIITVARRFARTDGLILASFL